MTAWTLIWSIIKIYAYKILETFCIISLVIVFTRIMKCYSAGELEPKFKTIIVWLFLSISSLLVLLNIQLLF